MFNFIKKAASTVADTASAVCDSASDTATKVASTVADTASAAYDSASDTATKAASSIVETASESLPFIEKVIMDGLLELSADFLNDEQKIRDVSMILWQRIPPEARFFMSEDKFHGRFNDLRLSMISKMDEKNQLLLVSDDNAE